MDDSTQGEKQRLAIRLTDTKNDRVLKAEEMLKRLFKPTFDGLTVEAIKADYDFVQLDAWHKALQDAFTLPGVSLTDVQESTNRVVVGVEDPQTQALAVRALAAERGVPDQALEIIKAFPVTQTLKSKRRPLRGGTQIQFQTGSLGAGTASCTLGVPVVLNGVKGFITNSHCSRTRNELDNGRCWQPTRPSTSSSQIGTEEVDPGTFTGGPCPAGKRCRWSDSLFVRAHDPSHIVPGTIARLGFNTLTWDGSSLWRVTGARTTVEGIVVYKVGRTTGLSNGTVIQACVNVSVSGDTGLVMICEATSNMVSDSGDSGSPVFQITNSPTANDVAFMGLHWGKGTDGNGNAVAFYTPYDGIKSDLSPANKSLLSVCTAGFTIGC